MSALAPTLPIVRRIVDVLLLALVVLGLAGIILGKAVPFVGYPVLVIVGGSMEPAIHLGAAAILERVDADQIAVGDVVSFKTGQQTTFTHRVTRIAQRDDGIYFETKGDANETIDPVLSPSWSMLGRVSSSIPYAGYLLAWMSIPVAVMFMLLLGGVLTVFAWLLESLELDLAWSRHRAAGDAVAPPVIVAQDRAVGSQVEAGAVARHVAATRRSGRVRSARVAPG